jgi:hypothetical protein
MLRPTVEQQFFVYLENLTDKPIEGVTVEVQAGGAAVEGGAVAGLTVQVDKPTPVVFAKGAPPAPPVPPPPALPGDKPPAVKPPPPPGLEEVKGDLAIRVFDKDRNDLCKPLALTVSPPADYVEIEGGQISFDPNPGNGKTNVLTVTLKAKPGFAGPKCRIDMVLDPKFIPGLVETPKKDGTRGGNLSRANGTVKLAAENLVFKDEKDRQGTVYLTIDGWERAYIFNTTFPADKAQSSQPVSITDPVVKLTVPALADPGAPLPVALQIDSPQSAVTELGFDRDADGVYNPDADEIFTFPGDRRVKMLVGAGGPGGCLLLKPEVADWKTELEVTGVVGDRTLRVRRLQDGAPASFLDAEKGATTKEIVKTVTLNGAPPGVKLVRDEASLPPKLARGADLPVKAKVVGYKPEEIQQVVFFVGKPGPDGGPPPNAVQATGELSKKEPGVYVALLAAPTDLKGKLDVSVRVLNVANVAATDTVKIELVDPTPPGGGATAGKGGSIEGFVTEGGRVQAGLEVGLRDNLGVFKDTTKTDAKGKFLFKDVPAGSYQVSAAKTSANTKGAVAVEVVDGTKKTDVEVKLTR